MDLLEVMRTRRSVRSYKREKVSEGDIMTILQAGMLSASGKAIRPWEFVVIEDRETLNKMAGCRSGGVKMLKEAALAIAVIANENASDVWIEDCAAVMSNMHLMAHALGLGSCWVQGRLRKAQEGRNTELYIKDILDYPDDYRLLAILTVGVPNEEKEGYELSSLPVSKIHQNKFNG